MAAVHVNSPAGRATQRIIVFRKSAFFNQFETVMFYLLPWEHLLVEHAHHELIAFNSAHAEPAETF
jgi:hypothetical protein